MWKLISDILKSFILVISAIIPILGFIGIHDYNALINKLKSNSLFSYIIIISIIVFLLMSLGEYSFKGKKIRKRSDALHKIFHDIRNFSCDKILNKDDFYKAVENICNYFDKISGHKFHVCIKTFEFANNEFFITRDEIENLPVETLARAGNNIEKRKKSDQLTHKVIDNTDFSSILFEKKSNIFSCSNLLVHILIGKILNPSQQYKNSDKEFYTKYLANIVIPIRIEKIFFNPKSNDKYVLYNDYITVGFLCIDCRAPISLILRKEINGVGKAFADALFEPLYKHINE